MKNIVQDLKPKDYMNVLLFAGGSAVLSPSGSRPANEANQKQALAFIQSRRGGGGTNILPALARALALPRTPGVSRIVTVVTDGYVHVEPQVFQLIRDHLGTANLFAFGIGTAVNRHLIEGMARAGLGEPFVVLNPGQAAKEAARFRQYIANPVLTDIKVSYEGFSASQVEPEAVPDLFALRPLTILGKYRGSPTGAIVVRGQTAKGPYEYRLNLPAAKAGPENAALRLLWARQRVMRLVDFSRFDRQNQAVVQEVTALGLKYSLMTPYTSFVAVDQVKRADGQVVTVKQPLPLPQGVSDLAVGGGMAKAMMPAAPPSGMRLAQRSLGYPATDRQIKTGHLRQEAVTREAGGSVSAAAKVKLTIREYQVKESPAAAAIQQALEAQLAKLARCCQDAAKTGIKLPGEITVTFTIGLDGQITGDPKFTMTPPQKSLENCLAAALKRIRFSPPLKTAVPVTVKFALTGK
jgi:Ca-activated chloride channel family protein